MNSPTQTSLINPRWRAQIEGDDIDIADLKVTLEKGAIAQDSFILDNFQGQVPTLTTTRWDKLTTHTEVEAEAKTALRLLGGCLNVFNACGKMQIGTIYEVEPDGRFIMRRTTEFKITVKKAEQDRISPTEFSRMISLCQTHEWLNTAFIELAAPVDWYAIYRAVEAIRLYLGGDKQMERSAAVDGKRLVLVKQQANSFRHMADGNHKPPNPPITLNDGENAVREAIVLLTAKLR